VPLLTPIERDAESVELMDRPAALEEISGCLHTIVRFNGLFGGGRLTLRHVRDLLAGLPADRPVTVLDVGAGAADIPVALVRWARRSGRGIRVVALDRDGATLKYARGYAAAYPEITLLQGDALALPVRPGSVDVVISAMTLHHLQPQEATRYLAEMDAAARLGWIMNDLVRSRAAHRLVWVLTRLLSRSAMARHDGPLSILRSYRPAEVVALCEKAGLFDVKVVHHHAFIRLCAVRAKA
jgi:2-polyprenyl-3-methyl-5-hydroxy-6-metoxy-1,4-benzoquinol methylase